MTVQIIIDVNDYATGPLRNLDRKLDPPQKLLQVAGKSVEVCLRDHFLKRNSEPNKKGWAPNNFWSRIRKAVVMIDADNTKASVAIAAPAINQKIYGGTITPKRGSALALPATAAAYASGSPREGATPMLKFMFAFDPTFDRWRPALVAAEDYARRIVKGKRAGQLANTKDKAKATAGSGTVWYWLCRSVTQAPDPRALPDEQDIQAGIYSAVEDYLGIGAPA